MSGAAFGIEVEALNLESIDERFAQLVSVDLTPLLEGIGAALESSTRKRIHKQKTSPDGAEWQPWSGRYSETRHGNQSLLESTGALLDSIQHEVSDGEVSVGSNLVYAATHQYGDPDRNIPERPYLGLSLDDEIAINDLTVAFLDKALR